MARRKAGFSYPGLFSIVSKKTVDRVSGWPYGLVITTGDDTMTYQVFTADTISGKYSVAVSNRKDMLPGDARSDAFTVTEVMFGRGARLSSDSRTIRKLVGDFAEVRGCVGWGYIARINRGA